MTESGGGETSVSSVRRSYIVLTFLLCALVFVVAYSQSPLFTSNQNQYFLHGLARAGLGHLRHDWLTNTVDPTPVFSYLVGLIYTIFRFPEIFHLVYLALLGIYFLACLGIARNITSQEHILASYLFLVLFTIIHSAAFRFALSKATSPDWSYLFEGGLAGQRILGTVLQPSSFGILFLVSIYSFLLRKYPLAVFIAVLAAVLHPTYLLTSAILVCSYLWGIFQESRKGSSAVWLALFALLLALPVAAFALISFWPSSPEEYAHAQELLVSFRIPHHTIISEWLDASSVFQLGWVFLAAYLARRTRLLPVFVTGITAGFVLSAVQVLSSNDALALLFPWRISSILVPLATTVLLALLVEAIFDQWEPWLDSHAAFILISGSIVFLLAGVTGIYYFVQEYSEKLSSPETELFKYVEMNKLPEDTYLTPIDMQDFRLSTGAPVYIDFKSIPYQDLEVLEWHRRVLLASEFFRKNKVNCDDLSDWFTQENITHVVLTSAQKEPDCSYLAEIFRNEDYRMFRFSK